VLRDEAVIESARAVALKLIESDPTLSNNKILATEVEKLKRQDETAFIDKG
jgi:hypothetical protein